MYAVTNIESVDGACALFDQIDQIIVYVFTNLFPVQLFPF